MCSPRLVLTCLVIGSCALAASAACAQDDRTVAGRVRQCRSLSETAARVACYDNIDVGTEPASAAPAAIAAPPQASRPGAFGSNQLSRAPDVRAVQPERIEAGVAAVTEREPGILLFTLADDTQWLSVDTVSQSYKRPRRGATVEIVSASMDSYLMRYGSQRSIRVRRVR